MFDAFRRDIKLEYLEDEMGWFFGKLAGFVSVFALLALFGGELVVGILLLILAFGLFVIPSFLRSRN